MIRCASFIASLCLAQLALACMSEPVGTSSTSATSTGTDGGTGTSAHAGTSTSTSTSTGTSGSDGASASSGTEPTGAASADPSTAGATSTGTTEAGSTSGGDGLGADAEAAVAALEAAVAGVLWPSESDVPWTVFALAKAAPVTIDNVKARVGEMVIVDGEPPLAEQLVEEEPWTMRFAAMTTPQPWWGDYEMMRAQQYAALQAVLEAHLLEIKLFRIGPDAGGMLLGAIDMFVIGETADGDLVGVRTVSIET